MSRRRALRSPHRQPLSSHLDAVGPEQLPYGTSRRDDLLQIPALFVDDDDLGVREGARRVGDAVIERKRLLLCRRWRRRRRRRFRRRRCDRPRPRMERSAGAAAPLRLQGAGMHRCASGSRAQFLCRNERRGKKESAKGRKKKAKSVFFFFLVNSRRGAAVDVSKRLGTTTTPLFLFRFFFLHYLSSSLEKQSLVVAVKALYIVSLCVEKQRRALTIKFRQEWGKTDTQRQPLPLLPLSRTRKNAKDPSAAEMRKVEGDRKKTKHDPEG